MSQAHAGGWCWFAGDQSQHSFWSKATYHIASQEVKQRDNRDEAHDCRTGGEKEAAQTAGERKKEVVRQRWQESCWFFQGRVVKRGDGQS